MYLQDWTKRINQLQNQISILKNELSTCPNGQLVTKRCGKYTKYYLRNGDKKEYLTKSQRPLVFQLARKGFLSAELSDLEYELSVLKKGLYSNRGCHSAIETYLKNPSHVDLIRQMNLYGQEDAAAWLKEPFESNPVHPEQLKISTLSGTVVRSKSEGFIADSLFLEGIPFRYECALQFGERVIYPDFMILDALHHRLIIWEHFGMMDFPAYSDHAFWKLGVYNANGYLMNVNLIATFETSEHPLDSAEVHRQIQLLQKMLQ